VDGVEVVDAEGLRCVADALVDGVGEVVGEGGDEVLDFGGEERVEGAV